MSCRVRWDWDDQGEPCVLGSVRRCRARSDHRRCVAGARSASRAAGCPVCGEHAVGGGALPPGHHRTAGTSAATVSWARCAVSTRWCTRSGSTTWTSIPRLPHPGRPQKRSLRCWIGSRRRLRPQIPGTVAPTRFPAPFGYCPAHGVLCQLAHPRLRRRLVLPGRLTSSPPYRARAVTQSRDRKGIP